ncbi:hypothetical protein J2X31_000128 [Flavobacterium arsenatis]|uniref:Secretion system C-terminal sorting domain-containing protein n=1 Tax=Flavobacterium arsenatis TaxID=1484332 RepID=A0ABU1TJI0_9FLAO|nr:T9SS type A sorting domain-containing protein [Flavobacterium arsenatis]MDR6966135.1 hypothetical protein [Flavobacterium arsenatis]
MKRSLYITLLSFLLCTVTTEAQTCDFYMDSARSGNNILLATRQNTVGNTIGKVVLTKLDASGSEIWAVAYNQSDEVKKVILHEDGSNFCFLEIHYYNGMHISKIDMQTGALLWQSQQFLKSTLYSDVVRVLVRKSEIILICSNLTEVNNISGGHLIYKISKGAAPVTELIHQWSGTFLGNLVQDSKENIIYGYAYNFNQTVVPHIRKINGYNFDAPMWDKEYNTTISPNLMELDELLMDAQDNLYLVSGADDIDVFKVDSNNGNQIWGLNSVNSSVYGSRMAYAKFYDGHLYMSLEHTTVGASTSYFAVKKINTETGTQAWTGTAPQMTIPPLGPNFPNYQAASHFDIGCDGSIYATGYCGSYGYENGGWAVMKINGTTGAKIAEKIVDNDMQLDALSNGYAAFVMNDEPLFIGNKQNGSVVARAIVRTDTDLNDNGIMLSPCAVLSVEDLTKSNIKLYPNPATDVVNISLEDNKTIKSILLYAVDGRKMGSWEDHQNNITIASYPTGVYIMKLTDSDNKVFYRKIIKK